VNRRRSLTIEQRRTVEAFLFLTPWLIGGAMFFLVPILQSIRLSFSEITTFVGFKMQFIGLDNYARAFVWDVEFLPMFLDVVSQTLINTPLILVFSLFISLLLNRDIRFKGFYRASFFLPVLLGTGFVMQQLLGQRVDEQANEIARGILMPRQVLLYLGPTVANLVQTFLDRITIILWRSGVQILLFLAGLQGISGSLYESAKCDGASEWVMFWKITLPMLLPVVILNSVFTIVESFTDVANPIVDYVIEVAFNDTQFEYAAAMGWIYLVFVFVIVSAIFLTGRRRRR
jgi:ABC-type sugar transport system permease subunit